METPKRKAKHYRSCPHQVGTLKSPFPFRICQGIHHGWYRLSFPWYSSSLVNLGVLNHGFSTLAPTGTAVAIVPAVAIWLGNDQDQILLRVRWGDASKLFSLSCHVLPYAIVATPCRVPVVFELRSYRVMLNVITAASSWLEIRNFSCPYYAVFSVRMDFDFAV